MEQDILSPLSMTLLGSSLRTFEESNEEFSYTSTLGNTVMHQEVGYKPFLVTIYESNGSIQEFITRNTSYIGTYYLFHIEEDNECPILDKPMRVVIHVPTKPEDWIEVRLIIQDDRLKGGNELNEHIIFDITCPSHLGIIEGKVDARSRFYQEELYQ